MLDLSTFLGILMLPVASFIVFSMAVSWLQSHANTEVPNSQL